MNRRKFLQQTAMASGSLLASGSLMQAAASPGEETRLVILHTNDVHSRIDPFPMDGGKNQGLGGVAIRSEIIKQIRSENEHVLLLDAGDIFQGTPYFNIYKGQAEIKAMEAMQYDACTMGNHDFDGGIENFATQLRHARFPVVNCNYDFVETPMEGKAIPYKIIKKGNLKIGILGVGIQLEGLVPSNLYGNTKYIDPIQKANETAAFLKKKEACDIIVCLSHLGYKYTGEDKISDEILAAESENIDLVIGGHTHTFLDNPVVKKNKNGSDVVINQVGWAGIILGRLDYTFSPVKKKNFFKSHPVVIAKKRSI